MSVITNTIKIIKLQYDIAKQSSKIKALKEKRAKAYDDKISKLEKARAENTKKLTKLGGTLEGSDCDEKGKAKKPKAKPASPKK